ncbi:TraR/DksA C4-type zinc finger protein [Candidatus Wolfebacteria bacterium]|nr:TraR/DksA C4-type zinc finger protein [Candidatus Wolfebacteria bacterium]
MDTEKYKVRLEEEKKKLEGEMSGVGQKNPNNPKDWEPTPANDGELDIDKNELADNHEESMERSAILNELEARHKNVVNALDRIEKGTYGICEKSGEQIEEDRLDANPAARTSKAHMND